MTNATAGYDAIRSHARSPERKRLAALADAHSLIFGVVAALSVTHPFEMLTINVGAVVLAVSIPSLMSVGVRWPDLLALSLVVLTFASQSWSVSPVLTASAFSTQFACTALFISIRSAAVTTRAMFIIAMGYVVGCVMAAVALIRQSDSLRYTLSGPRVSLVGINPNYTGYSLAGLAAVVVLLICLKPRRVAFFLVVAVVGYGGMLLTGTRGAYLAVSLVAIWFLWWRVFPRVRRASLRGIYIAVVLAGAAIFTGILDGALRTYALGQGDRDDGMLNGRLAIWPRAREVFWEGPLFGQGAGTFPKLNSRGIYAHDALLDIGQGLGLLGLVGYVTFLVVALISGTRRAQPEARTLLIGSFLCAAAPPLLSGYWYAAPAFWVTLALFSRIDAVEVRQPGSSSTRGRRSRDAGDASAQRLRIKLGTATSRGIPL